MARVLAWSRWRADCRFSPTEVADNVDGRLPGMMRSVGFQSVASTVRLSTVFGTLELLRGTRVR